MVRVRCLAISAAVVLAAWSAAAGQSATESASAQSETAQDVLLRLADRIADEAERQHYVNHRMDLVIERFAQLLRDLASNDLIKQGDGPQIEQLTRVLGILSTRHVPNAARYLEEARRQLQALRPKLSAADREIDVILGELERILARGAGQTEDLLRELEVIIEDEKRTHQETKDWGAELIQDPASAEMPGKEIASRQQRIARRTDRFIERLAKARDAETDPAEHLGMQQAHDVLDRNKVVGLLDSAGRDVDEKKPVAAAQEQADALRALEEAARHLRRDNLAADLQAMKELREKLAAILAEQIALRETTDKVPEPEFPEKANQLQVEQRGLDNELQDASTNLPQATSPQLKTHLDAADGHMQQAEQRIAATQQQPAVGSQKAAEQALRDALEQLEADIAAAEQAWQQQFGPMQSLADVAQQALDLAEKQRALMAQTGQTPTANLPQLAPPQTGLQQQAQALAGQVPMPQFQQAAGHMQQASQQLQQSQQPPAMQQQQQAIDALLSAAQALQRAQAAIDLAMQQAALMQQTGQTPQQGLPQLASPQQGLQGQAQAGQFPQAAGLMGQAAQALQAGQGQPAMQSQQAAINALLGQAGMAMGMQPGTGMGMMPGMGFGMGLMPGLGMGLMASPLSQTNQPQEMGIRYFGRGGAGGADVQRGTDYWNPLGGRERDTLYQKYVQQLPPEYRDLLGDYYEALSTDVPPARTPAPAPRPAEENP